MFIDPGHVDELRGKPYTQFKQMISDPKIKSQAVKKIMQRSESKTVTEADMEFFVS
jgi:hypothetical protein